MKSTVPNFHKIEALCQTTRQLIRHQKEKEKLRGEKFNIFSILKMESRENATHSAFLAELLNPKGTHLRGNIFLKLFLESIGNKDFDADTAKVKVEHYIGKRDDQAKTGGRIDIFIWDKKQNCLSIENKIYAGDQYAQMERYCKHNKGKNTVYYLTLWGSHPSKESHGELVADEHFYLISYRKHIVSWLEACLKEAADFPMLRESIKQYILLIKKLTHTMNHEQEAELLELIMKNYEEAQFLWANVFKAIAKFKAKIRKSVFDLLQQRISDKYNIYYGSGTDQGYSQIWIKIKGKEEQKVFFGIQSFSASRTNQSDGLFVGIFVFNGKYVADYERLGTKRSDWWSAVQPFSDYDGSISDLYDDETLKRLFAEPGFYKGFVNHVVEETIQYLEAHYDDVASFLK